MLRHDRASVTSIRIDWERLLPDDGDVALPIPAIVWRAGAARPAVDTWTMAPTTVGVPWSPVVAQAALALALVLASVGLLTLG